MAKLQEYILTYPHHGIENWLILQNFYNGLTSTSRAHIDAVAGGAFFSLIVSGATRLQQGWSEDRLQTQRDGLHTVEEMDMLAAKLDLLIKCLDKKRSTYGTVQSLYSHIPYEVCRNFGHLGNDCLETREDVGTRTTGSVHKEI
jgi:hypothetical protein